MSILDDEDKLVSLDDIEQEYEQHSHSDEYNEDDWSDSFDDMGPEAWDHFYHNDEETLDDNEF